MNRRWVLFLAFAGLLSATACADATAVDSGRLSVLLTDAPGDVLQAWVTIERIEVVGDDDDDNAEGTEGTTEETGKIVLRDDAVTTELLALRDDVAELVSGASVPAGFYSQLRFIIPEACIEVEVSDTESVVYSSSPDFTACGDVVDGQLHMPSFGSSGLKIKMPGGAIEVTDDLTVLLVDFDVAQSFGKQAGNSGRWVMRPVVKATEA